jgi:hypothetical protein
MPDDLTDEMLADRIKALLEERAGPAAGDPERIEAINRELARFGHDAKPPTKRASTRTTHTKTKE